MARESRETWIKRVDRWRESGLTAKEFAAEVGVNAGTLAHWKYRLSAETRHASGPTSAAREEAVTFVEVKAAAAKVDTTSVEPPAFEVVLASGAVVRVPAHFDSATLRRLLDVMATR
jgi:hypothetical protein